MRFRLLTEYDGTAYSGWQIQNGQITIQGEIEKALARVFGMPVRIIAAGRTDTGVHAKEQVAHFDYASPIDVNKLMVALNGILNRDIRVSAIESVPADFHARYSAKLREYRYYISRVQTVFLRDYTWYLSYHLDLKRMNKAAHKIIGHHDFKGFCRSQSEVDNHFCTIRRARWIIDDNLSVFVIQADRFLHGMVRALVGTFVDIGRSKWEINKINEILTSRDRSVAGQAAPAKGLILEKVYY
jgi:tRNA pseudouridine38-40 synthase